MTRAARILDALPGDFAPLVVEPFGGLGNRMRATASAVLLAAAARRPLDIVWSQQPHLNAAFTDLFEPSPQFRVHDRPGRLRWARRTHRADGTRRPEAAMVNALLGVSCCVVDDDYAQIWRGEIDLPALFRHERRLYVRTCQELDHGTRLSGVFQPAAPLQARVDRLCADFAARTIGVHIRGTDHVHRAESPMESFIEAMNRELATDPQSVFFLCTDEPAIEAALIDRFGPRIVRQAPKALSRDSTPAIQDAVVDLFSLARTQTVLGSYASSFSDVAARIGGIALNVVRR